MMNYLPAIISYVQAGKLMFNKAITTSFLILIFVNISYLALANLPSNFERIELTITGKVTDQNGETLPGVNILIKGTGDGVATDIDGNYSIKVPSSTSILVFSFIGFKTEEIEVGSKSVINIRFQTDVLALDEVMVVAYGSVAKSSFVGSSAGIKATAIEMRPVSNALNALTGVAPGVQTTMSNGAPGSTPKISVRGFGSVTGSNDALYVVDGIPYDGENTNTINPDDIESITVLKDASTTALYGSRGANGVIMITTKKGKEGKGNFNVNISGGVISRGLKEYDRLDAKQYYPAQWEVYRNSLERNSNIPRDIANSIASGLTTTYEGKNYTGIADQLVYNPFNVAKNKIVDINGVLNPDAQLIYGDDLDWAKAIQRGGKKRKNVQISYDGGSKNTTYFASLGYTKEEGYLLNSDFERFTARININTQVTKWLKTGINLNGSYAKSNLDNTSGSSSFVNPFNISRSMGPIYPVHLHDATTGAYILDDKGNKQYDRGDSRPNASARHPIWENQLNVRNQIDGGVGARTFATVQILPNLTATTNLSFDLLNQHLRRFDNPIIGDGSPAGRAYQGLYRTTSMTWNQIIEYSKTKNKHTISLLGGHENYTYKYNYLYVGRSGMIVDGIIELPNFATILTADSYEDNRSIESYFARGNYEFDKKYIVNLSIRRDGNSRFAKGVRWANFWAIGAGYNIEQEEWFNANWIDLLKIRSSYGTVGNDQGLGYYPYQALYDLGMNNALEPGLTQSSISNEKLTWESAKNFDIGIDYTALKGRLSGSIEYFHRTTDGLIFEVPLAISNGGKSSSSDVAYSVYKNIGSLYNKGLEFSLTGQIIQGAKFNYSTTLNVTHLKNQITKMPDTQKLIQTGSKGLSVGHSIFDFYLRDFYSVDPETGDALYKTNTITSNTRIIGTDTVTAIIGEANYRYTGASSIPKIYGSMNHNLSYKNFTLNIVFTYQIGGKIYDSGYLGLMHGGTYGSAMHVDALNRWQKPGDITQVPRFDNTTTNQAGGSTRFLTNASYLQLNNISLSYKIPDEIASKIGSKGINVYGSAENLALFSARKGMDVSGSFNGTVSNSYTFNRVISLGAKFKF